MEDIPRPFSPPYVPQPLNPSPFRTRFLAPERVATPAVLPERSGTPLYLSTVGQPTQEPNDIIHDYYNVSPISFRLEPDGSIPRTVEMPLVRVTNTRPTHVLAVLSNDHQPRSGKLSPSCSSDPFYSSLSPSASPSPSSPDPSQHADPYLIPIDAESFFLTFGHNVARSLGTALTTRWARSSPPLIRFNRTTGTRFITLPVIPLYVPHPSSVPHVLLFGQAIPLPNVSPTVCQSPCPPSPPRSILNSHGCAGPGSSPSTLATYLLPLAAIEEFPSAPAMAAVMARQCTEGALRTHAAFNQGIWRNVLLLVPTDTTLVDLVRIAWNVTSEARRLQLQLLMASAPVMPSPPPSPAIKSIPSTTACDVAKDAVEEQERGLPRVSPAPLSLPVTSSPIKPQTVPRDVAKDADTRERHHAPVSLTPLPPPIAPLDTTRDVPQDLAERKRYKSPDPPNPPVPFIPPVPRIPSVLSASPALSISPVLSVLSVPSVPPALAPPLPSSVITPTAVKFATTYDTTNDATGMEGETARPPVSKLTRDIARDPEELDRHLARPMGFPGVEGTSYVVHTTPSAHLSEAPYAAMPSFTARARDLRCSVAPRLPVIEVDYPVDFAMDIQVAIAESFEQLSF